MSIIILKFYTTLILDQKYSYKHSVYTSTGNRHNNLIRTSHYPLRREETKLLRSYMAFLRLQKEEAAELKYGVRQPHSKAYILTYCPILPLKSWFGNARMPLNNSNTDCQWLDRHTLLIQLQRRGQWLRDRQTQEIFTGEVNFDWKWLFRIYWISGKVSQQRRQRWVNTRRAACKITLEDTWARWRC